MKDIQICSLGAFMQAAAHYIHNADNDWWVAWIAVAIGMLCLNSVLGVRAP